MEIKVIRLLFACCFSVLLSFPLYAQKTPKPFFLNIAYYGNNGWNPGLSIGFEYLKREEDDTNKKGRTLFWQRLITGKLGFYLDPGSHLGLFNHYGIMRRKVFPNGFHTSFGISPLGIYRSFLPETYQVSPDGNITSVSLPGRLYYAPVVVAGLGKKPAKKEGPSIFFHTNIITLLPYNTYVLPLINLELGIRVPIIKEEK